VVVYLHILNGIFLGKINLMKREKITHLYTQNHNKETITLLAYKRMVVA
jgi:hypothetical protein